MKSYLPQSLLLFLAFFMVYGCKSNPNTQKVENIKTFAKLYGYVRWFHPSDEAQTIDWDQFAIAGISMVETAENPKALKDSLEELFLPLAPSLQFSFKKNSKIDFSRFTPDNSVNYKPVFWHHSGVKLNNTPVSLYNSLRFNRMQPEDYMQLPAISKFISVNRNIGESVELTFDIKVEKGGNVNLFFDCLERTEYGRTAKSTKISNSQNGKWESKTFTCDINPRDAFIYFAFNELSGTEIFIDNLSVNGVKSDSMKTCIYKSSLDDYQKDEIHKGINLPFKVRMVARNELDSCISICFHPESAGPENKPQFGEMISEEIHDGLFIDLPLVLYASDESTYPASKKSDLKILKSSMYKKGNSKMYSDIAALLISWNIIQHFFPYFDEIDIDWEKEFEKALYEVYGGKDFDKIVKKLMAKLKDGHVVVRPPRYIQQFALPLKWEWINGELVVTEIYRINDKISVGDKIVKLDGKSTEDHFAELRQYISSPTIGLFYYLSQFLSLYGEPGESISIQLEGRNGEKRETELSYNLSNRELVKFLKVKEKQKVLDNNVYYLNLDQITMEEIDSLIPRLINCNGLICDLRGYPKSNHNLLRHLLSVNDTVDNWMLVPQVNYPNRNKMKFIGKGWEIEPKLPHINAPVVFITDGRAISYAESVLLFVKHYNLATIVGQPSAGTNGSINSFKLPNGYIVNFTGMKVTNLDGSQHYNIGVLPDVYVERSVNGVCSGKDEFLEKAIEIIKSNL